MRASRVGGVYYGNYGRLERLRPRYKPNGYRGGQEIANNSEDLSNLIWLDAIMAWGALTETWQELS